jgi:hypothetical protein
MFPAVWWISVASKCVHPPAAPGMPDLPAVGSSVLMRVQACMPTLVGSSFSSQRAASEQ